MIRVDTRDTYDPQCFSRPVDLRGFKEIFYSNMKIDESKPMDDQYLSQDMMAIQNGRYTIDVGYYGDSVVTIYVFNGNGWNDEPIIHIECATYDKLYDQLNTLLEIFSRI